jgi:hypothetical protein
MRSTTSLSAVAGACLLTASLVAAQQQCTGLTGAAKDACDMEAAFGGSTVFPDVIPTFDPSGALYVTYGTATVGGAQQLSPSKVSSAPTVAYTAVNGSTSGASYLLAFVDPDGSKPDALQWLTYGLSAGTDGTLSGGTDAAAYVGPDPPQGSGSHRCVFVLYQQPSGFSLPSSAADLPGTLSGGRLGFSLSSFVSAAKLGDPVGGSFFKATFDGVAVPPAPAASTAASSTASASGSSHSPSTSHSPNAGSSQSGTAAGAASTPAGAASASAGTDSTSAGSGSSSSTSTSSGGRVEVAVVAFALVAGAAAAALA